MTEETQPSPVDSLREEFMKEIMEMKNAFSAETKDRDERIAELTKINEDLRRALVRNTVLEPPPEQPPERTPEEIHEETVRKEAKVALDIIKRGTYL